MTSPAEHLDFLTDVHNRLEGALGKTNQELSQDDVALHLLKTEASLPASVPAELRLAEGDAAASQEVTVTFYLSDDGNSGHIRIEQYEALQTIFTFSGVTFRESQALHRCDELMLKTEGCSPRLGWC